jgi:hypothetical protein
MIYNFRSNSELEQVTMPNPRNSIIIIIIIIIIIQY